MLSSLLRASRPSCHLPSATQLPGDSSHRLRRIRVPSRKASDTALVCVPLLVQGCMAAAGLWYVQRVLQNTRTSTAWDAVTPRRRCPTLHPCSGTALLLPGSSREKYHSLKSVVLSMDVASAAAQGNLAVLRGTHGCASLSPAPQLLHLPSLSQKSGLLRPFPELSLNKQPLTLQSSLCSSSCREYLMGAVLYTSNRQQTPEACCGRYIYFPPSDNCGLVLLGCIC